MAVGLAAGGVDVAGAVPAVSGRYFSGDANVALVKCKDCGRDVSDRAAACIGCGAPMAWSATTPAPPADGELVTTQLTAKSLKLHAGFAVLGMMVTLVLGFAAGPAWFGAFAIAACWYFAVKLATWWRHG